MLHLTLITLGKLKEPFWKSAQQEYLKRLKPFCKLQIIELKEESFSEKDSPDIIKQKEARKIQEVVPKGFVVLLDERGGKHISTELAEQLTKWTAHETNLTFVIGGPLGFDQSLYQMSDATLSLSPLTFTHQMARVILLEQLYRAFMIQQGRTYHY